MDAPTRFGALLLAIAVVVAGVPSVALALSNVHDAAPQVDPDDGPADPPVSGGGEDTDAGDTTTTDTTTDTTTARDANRSRSNAPNGSNASLTFRNHTAGGESVLVESVTLPAGGFVTIHDTRGERTEIVGVTPYLDAGTHSGTVRLGRVPGAARNLTRLGSNASLIARLHRDTDGDRRFDNLTAPGTDRAYRANGTPVEDRARVRVPSDRRASSAAVTIENQTTDGTTVEVASATLPASGFVALYRINDSSLPGSTDEPAAEAFLEVPDETWLENRSAIAATDVLAPGTYTALTLTIGANATGSDLDRLRENTSVAAVVHNDTDANGRSNPNAVGGDRPERADGGIVADTAMLGVDTVGTVGTTTARRSPTATATTTLGAAAETDTQGSTRTARADTTRQTRTETATTTDEPARTATAPEDTTVARTPGTATRTERSVEPGVITGGGTDTGPDATRGGPEGQITPYGWDNSGERRLEAVQDNPLLSVFGMVVVVLVALVVIDWRRTDDE